jgi:hypothetical protein
MAISIIRDATTKLTNRGIHIGIHSVGGVGKTTFGATIAKNEKGLLVQTGEDGLSPLKIENVPHYNLGCNNNVEDINALANAYKEYQEILKQFIVEKHDYKWLVQDPFTYFIKTSFESYIIQKYYGGDVTKANSYGSKYQEYQLEFNKLIEAWKAILNKGINICTLCHGVVVDFKDPSTESYKKWEVDLPIGNKVNIASTFYNHVDALLFGCYEVNVDNNTHKATGGNKRILRTTNAAAYTVKNMRLPSGRGLPDPIMFDWNIIKPIMQKEGANVGVCQTVPVEQKQAS